MVPTTTTTTEDDGARAHTSHANTNVPPASNTPHGKDPNGSTLVTPRRPLGATGISTKTPESNTGNNTGNDTKSTGSDASNAPPTQVKEAIQSQGSKVHSYSTSNTNWNCQTELSPSSTGPS